MSPLEGDYLFSHFLPLERRTESYFVSSPLRGEDEGGGEMKNKNIKFAKNLRKNVTDTEKYLWNFLRGNQLEGFKFRRQQPIGKYIIDFVNLERKIIIELDGGQHLENKEDKLRDRWLEEQGYEVLRFWDNEVFMNIEGVLEFIRKKLLSPSP